MRTLGFDVEYEKRIPDERLVRRAIEEGRVILTRDTLLMKRRAVRGRAYFVNSGAIEGQLKEIVKEFGTGDEGLLSRCIRCNKELADIGKEEVKEKVPPYVYETQERFSMCKNCGRIYWAGTHKDRMVEEIERLLG